MFSNVDPCNPARVEELDWFDPAFPNVRTIQALQTWKGGKHFKLLTHSFSTQAASLCVQDHTKMAVDHVKPHVAQVVTNAERADKSARSCALAMLDSHPTGEATGKAPAEGVLDADDADESASCQAHAVKTLLCHARDICGKQIVIRMDAWRLSHQGGGACKWCEASKTTLPKRVNSTSCFDIVSFVVLRREEGHAAQTWLKSVASHKDRLDVESKIPESVFVHMLLSQLTRNERMDSIDMVDDPSGVIALTWEKASQAVAGLAQANHALFSTDM